LGTSCQQIVLLKKYKSYIFIEDLKKDVLTNPTCKPCMDNTLTWIAV
jgi:hypothetical protein